MARLVYTGPVYTGPVYTGPGMYVYGYSGARARVLHVHPATTPLTYMAHAAL